VKLSIVKPGTNLAVIQRRKTLIKKAAIPNVRIEIGSAISCKIGRIKVFTTPIATAATIPDQIPDNSNPGTKKSTIKRAKTFTASRTISPILQY
jgi:hypothetical protein